MIQAAFSLDLRMADHLKVTVKLRCAPVHPPAQLIGHQLNVALSEINRVKLSLQLLDFSEALDILHIIAGLVFFSVSFELPHQSFFFLLITFQINKNFEIVTK